MTDSSVVSHAIHMQMKVSEEQADQKAVAYVDRFMKEEVTTRRWEKRWKASGYGWAADWGLTKYV